MAHGDPRHPFSTQGQAATSGAAWPHTRPLRCCVLPAPKALRELFGKGWRDDKVVPQCHQPWPLCPQDFYCTWHTSHGLASTKIRVNPLNSLKGHLWLPPGSGPHGGRRRCSPCPGWRVQLRRGSPCPWGTPTAPQGLEARTSPRDTRRRNTHCVPLASAQRSFGDGTWCQVSSPRPSSESQDPAGKEGARIPPARGSPQQQASPQQGFSNTRHWDSRM